jgi:hypothetical protein
LNASQLEKLLRHRIVIQKYVQSKSTTRSRSPRGGDEVLRSEPGEAQARRADPGKPHSAAHQTGRDPPGKGCPEGQGERSPDPREEGGGLCHAGEGAVRGRHQGPGRRSRLLREGKDGAGVR